MRRIDKIIIHCSATNPEQDFNAADIDRWHKARGWSGIGYHFVIKLDGTTERGRAIEKVGAHAFGYNKRSIGICYIGGVDMDGNPSDTRTDEQERALRALIGVLKHEYHLETEDIHGHNEFSKKACPSFNVKSENY
jgi:N-acetylmuramoyl-L-alanine amidase